MKLSGQVAIVTGAGRGIGKSIALKLAGDGAMVVVNDLDATEAEATVSQITHAGGVASSFAGNIAHDDFGDEIVQFSVQTFGSLDIIVNNAGYTWDAVVQKTTDEQWYAMIDCHLTAPFRLLRAAYSILKEAHQHDQSEGRRRHRKIVNVSSVAGMFGNPGQASYSSAKAGVMGLTKTLAREWGRINVNVNCVAFGLISTRLTADVRDGETVQIGDANIKIGVKSDLISRMEQDIPFKRMGTTEEAAGAVYVFCIPETNYVTGETLLCSGGLLAP